MLLRETRAAPGLILERVGEGRMYYRVGLEWASTDPEPGVEVAGIELSCTLRDADGALAESGRKAQRSARSARGP